MTDLPSFGDIAKSLEKGEIAKVEEQILKLREAARQLQQENSALREEIKELQEEKRIEPKIELADGVYWRLEGKERVGPFCPSCYHEYQQFVELLDGSRYVARTRWICIACNRVFD